jgi:four helix bundle protein
MFKVQMATVRRFEDLHCFTKARELTKVIYTSFRDCRDRGFHDQIHRAAISVVGGGAEGFESGTKQAFINYLYIAKAFVWRSARTTLCCLRRKVFKYLNIQIVKRSRGRNLSITKFIYKSSQVVRI